MRERDDTAPTPSHAPPYALAAFAQVVETHQHGLHAFLHGMVDNVFTPNSPHSLGAIWHFSDGKWAPYPLDNSCACILALRTLSLVSPTDIWAAGDHGTLLHYDGHTWQPMPSTGMDIVKLNMLSATHGLALLQSGDVVEYRDGA